MGSKLMTAFLAGIFFTFFLDFFLILGIFLNYIRPQEIDIYYNILFADNQNLWWFSAGVLIFGYMFVFLKNPKIPVFVFIISFAFVNLVQIPSIGKDVGTMLLAQEDKVFSIGKHTYIGTIVYIGRDTVWFYDDELNKIITFKKEEISE